MNDPIPGVAERLAVLRAENGLTQATFARSNGVSGAVYHAYERGTRTIQTHTLIRLGEVYGTSMNWLLRGIGPLQENDDMNSATEFLGRLQAHIVEQEITITGKSVISIIDRWLLALKEGRAIPFEDVTIWVDLLKD